MYRSPAVANPRGGGRPSHRARHRIPGHGRGPRRARPARRSTSEALSPDEIVQPGAAGAEASAAAPAHHGRGDVPAHARPAWRDPHAARARGAPSASARWPWRAGELYVTASAGLTGNGVVLRVDRLGGGRRARSGQVSPPELSVFELQTFRGALHAGTGDAAAGYGVWRLAGAGGAWRPLVQGGAGRGSTITSVVSMAVVPRPALRRRERMGHGGLPAVRADPDRTGRKLDAGGGQPAAGRRRRAAHGGQRPAGRLRQRVQLALLADAAVPRRARPGHERLELVRGDHAPTCATSCAEIGFDLYATCDGDEWFDLTRDALRPRRSRTSACGRWPRRPRGCSSGPPTTCGGPLSIARRRCHAQGPLRGWCPPLVRRPRRRPPSVRRWSESVSGANFCPLQTAASRSDDSDKG